MIRVRNVCCTSPRWQTTLNSPDLGVSDSAQISGKMVLIIDDNPHDRNIYRTVLEQSGYQVATAARWDDGSEAMDERRPDLILLDLILPGDTGWAAAQELRADSDTASIPIIIMSAHVVPRLDSRLRDLGVESCLEKPLDPDDLLKEVARLIGPAATFE